MYGHVGWWQLSIVTHSVRLKHMLLTSTLKEIDYKVEAIESINQRLLQHIDVRDSLMLDYTDKVLGLTQKCDTIVMVDTIYVYKFIEKEE